MTIAMVSRSRSARAALSAASRAAAKAAAVAASLCDSDDGVGVVEPPPPRCAGLPLGLCGVLAPPFAPRDAAAVCLAAASARAMLGCGVIARAPCIRASSIAARRIDADDGVERCEPP